MHEKTIWNQVNWCKTIYTFFVQMAVRNYREVSSVENSIMNCTSSGVEMQHLEDWDTGLQSSQYAVRKSLKSMIRF